MPGIRIASMVARFRNRLTNTLTCATGTMTRTDLAGIVEFLRATERLKVVKRSGFTSSGEPESVAEHSWRVTLMALLLGRRVPGIDLMRLLQLCIVHDLGEAVGGDVPAPEQARRRAAGEAGKSAKEREDLTSLVAPLPSPEREHMVALWDEYEAAATAEARLAKGIDKLETILQHVQGMNPPDFDYRFNLGYGRAHTSEPPLIADLRRILDDATERRARERSDDSSNPQ